MAIAYINAASGSGDSTSVVIAIPVGTLENHIMIACFSSRGGSSTTHTPPSGWTLIATNTTGSGSTDVRTSTYWKVAGGSEPANYTFTTSDWQRKTGGIITYSGVDTTDVLDANSTATGSTTTATGTSITTGKNGNVLVFCGGVNINGSFTQASGMVERIDQPHTGSTTFMDDETIATAGATGTRTVTVSTGNAHAVQMISLNVEEAEGNVVIFRRRIEAAA